MKWMFSSIGMDVFSAKVYILALSSSCSEFWKIWGERGSWVRRRDVQHFAVLYSKRNEVKLILIIMCQAV